MSWKRLPLIAAGLVLTLVLGGCQASSSGEIPQIFVGMSTVTPTSTPIYTPTPAPPTATPTPTPEPPPFDLHQTNNLLLLGTDRRPTWTHWRTDSIMIIGLDRQYQRAAVLSVPRDLYVQIPGYGQGRINQVDYIGEKILKTEGGGPAFVSQVLSDTLGIPTKHWVRVEMQGFQKLVDALGGVTVHLDCPFYEIIYDLDDNQWTYFELPSGDVLMDGNTAYRFVTLRYLESDFGRSRRQRQFLWALRDQALSSDLLLRAPELWTALRQTFATDLSLLQVLDLARFAITLEPNNVRASALTNKELARYITANGADVLRITDPSKIQAVIDNIWEAPSLANTNHVDPLNCRPKPQGVPGYLSGVPTPTPLPQGDQTEATSETVGTGN